MKVPVSWLKDFVDIDVDYSVLAEKLVSCGFEIEEIINQADKIKKIYTCKVLEIKAHPNADKLRVCQVEIGDETAQIVTNATNLNVGDIVPLAIDGAVTANGINIKKGELRGVKSDGMFCGLEELGLSPEDMPEADPHSVLVFKDVIETGLDINKIIGNDDIILDVAVTANRQDCNSILGIAREVAAVLGKKVKQPKLSYPVSNDSDISELVKVEVRDFERCPRYMAKAVNAVKITKSTPLMQKRLKAVGLRPINNFVDLTNYVLIEIGQPMHAFDLRRLKGNAIVVRLATNGEKIVCLDDKEYSLKNEDLVICDIDSPVAVAGVMGGKLSGIENDTTTVIFESAKFAKASVRHTSRSLNLRSDSSQRFEKGMDMLSQEVGLARCLSILTENGWGEVVEGTIDCKLETPKEKTLEINYKDINSIIGIDIEKEIMLDILNSLSFSATVEGDILKIIVPIFRDDIVGKNDIAEEIIRMYGYDNIVGTLIKDGNAVQGGWTIEQVRLEKLRNMLAGKGCFETYSYSFQSPKAFDILRLPPDDEQRKAILVANPIGEDFSVMRTNLSYSMLKTLAYNYLHGNKDCRLFEIARVYIPKALPLTELPVEKNKLCIGLIGESESFYTLKGIIEDIFNAFNISDSYTRTKISFMHEGRTANVNINGTVIGFVGEVNDLVSKSLDVDKRIYLAELDCDEIIKNIREYVDYKYISRYQSVERDIALLVPTSVTVADIISVIKEYGTELLDETYVFDEYIGDQVPKGKKSLAFKMIFRDMNKTLKDEEINNIIVTILKALEKQDAVLR